MIHLIAVLTLSQVLFYLKPKEFDNFSIYFDCLIAGIKVQQMECHVKSLTNYASLTIVLFDGARSKCQ